MYADIAKIYFQNVRNLTLVTHLLHKSTPIYTAYPDRLFHDAEPQISADRDAIDDPRQWIFRNIHTEINTTIWPEEHQINEQGSSLR